MAFHGLAEIRLRCHPFTGRPVTSDTSIGTDGRRLRLRRSPLAGRAGGRQVVPSNVCRRPRLLGWAIRRCRQYVETTRRLPLNFPCPQLLCTCHRSCGCRPLWGPACRGRRWRQRYPRGHRRGKARCYPSRPREWCAYRHCGRCEVRRQGRPHSENPNRSSRSNRSSLSSRSSGRSRDQVNLLRNWIRRISHWCSLFSSQARILGRQPRETHVPPPFPRR